MGKMMKFLVFLVAFHLLGHKEVKAELYAPFDFFKFVLTWPPSLCNDNKGCNRPLPEDFSIHGLWASNLTGDMLRKCYKVKYDHSIMSDIVVQELHIVWPNYKRGKVPEDDIYTWRHEWQDHGVCSLVWYEQEVYFNLVISLRKLINNLKSGLSSKGIVPGFNISYGLDDFRDAVQELTTKVPDLSCNYDKDKNKQLKEIRICYTPGGIIMDCPTNRFSNTCVANEYVNFPLL